MGQLNSESIFKNQRFIRMFIAYSISTFGDWFDMIAITVIIAFTWHANPMLIGLIPVTYALPGLILGSVAGVIADHSNKVFVMVISNFVSAVLTILLLFINHFYLLFIVLMVRSSIGLFYPPAQQALTKQIVHEDSLLKASSLNGMVMQTAKIAGPLLGSVVLAAFTPKLCLMLNAVSFVFSGIILMTIKNNTGKTVEKAVNKSQAPTDAQEDRENRESFRKAWIKGWEVVMHNKKLLHTFILYVIVLLVIQFMDIQIAVLLRNYRPDMPSLFGWIVASSGTGAIVSIPIMSRFKNIRYGAALGLSVASFAIGFALFGLLKSTNPPIMAIVGGFALGAGNGILFTTFQFLLQKETPEQLMGRVFGIVNTLGGLITIIAPIIGGILISKFGTSIIFLILSAIIGLIGAICFLFEKPIWYAESEYKRKPNAVIH